MQSSSTTLCAAIESAEPPHALTEQRSGDDRNGSRTTAQRRPPLLQFAYVPGFNDERLSELASLSEPEDWDGPPCPSRPTPSRTPELPAPYLRSGPGPGADRDQPGYGVRLLPHRPRDAAAGTDLHVVLAQRPHRSGRPAVALQGVPPGGRGRPHLLSDAARTCKLLRVLIGGGLRCGSRRPGQCRPHGARASRTAARVRTRHERLPSDGVSAGRCGTGPERVRQNHRTPAPQYFNGRLQFLLPLSFERPDLCDLVLAVEPYDEFYRATTCLTLAMAYSNARLLGRPDQAWLLGTTSAPVVRAA